MPAEVLGIESLTSGTFVTVVRGPSLNIGGGNETGATTSGGASEVRRRGPRGTGLQAAADAGDVVLTVEAKAAHENLSVTLGKYWGSNSKPDEVESIQFDFMQRVMRQDSHKMFNFITTENLISRFISTGQAVPANVTVCDQKNISSDVMLGAYDLVRPPPWDSGAPFLHPSPWDSGGPFLAP